MTASVPKGDNWRGSWFRRTMWGGAAFLLLLPALAMRWTTEVNWGASDFVFAGALLFGSAGIIDFAARANASFAYRAGVVVAVGAAFLTLWINGAVGMIGNEDNPYNLWFVGVLVLALAGAMVAGFKARGMAPAMVVAALAQAAAGAIGLAADLRGGVFSTLFAGLWLLAAALFRRAAQERPGE